MISRVPLFLVIAAIAGGLIPAAAARAQNATAYEPPPHFPYVGPTNSARPSPAMRKSHAKRRAAAIYRYRSVRCTHDCIGARRPARSRTYSAPGPIGHAGRAPQARHVVVNERRVVRKKPIVIEARHVVGEPARVVARGHAFGGAPASTRGKRVAKIESPAPRTKFDRGKKKERVIRADAEVTILGPDRMIIRLFRKNHRATESSARAD